MAKTRESKNYELDDRGRPMGYRNRETLRPHILRRRKADVEKPAPHAGPVPALPPLTAVELEKIAAYRTRATRKLKMARVLADAGLCNEAHEAVLEGVPALGRAFAIEQRLAEPATLYDCLAQPLASYWREALPLLRDFADGALETCIPLLSALAPLTNGQAEQFPANR